MKQEIMSFLYRCDDDIADLCKYLYENPESSYNELKCCKYICSLLDKYEFQITENYLNINNSFIAQKGTGHPKICYLCEYDAVQDLGHVTGHNLVTSMSVRAAIGLGNIINKIGGSVILIGCPGEYLGGTKATLVRQGVFEDIDVVMVAHPYTDTCESGSSSAIIPLSVEFNSSVNGLSFLNKDAYNALDALLLTFNILNSLKKGFPENTELNSVLSNGGYTPLLIPSKTEARFYIRSTKTQLAEEIDSKIREIVGYVSNLTNISHSFSLYEPPNKELISNHSLNRLFSHNLKESGIIHINGPRDVYAGLSIGDVSHVVPCIHPYISIIEDKNIKYGTKEFSQATITPFALQQCNSASLALISTAIDLIENSTLLSEVKAEFFESIK